MNWFCLWAVICLLFVNCSQSVCRYRFSLGLGAAHGTPLAARFRSRSLSFFLSFSLCPAISLFLRFFLYCLSVFFLSLSLSYSFFPPCNSHVFLSTLLLVAAIILLISYFASASGAAAFAFRVLRSSTYPHFTHAFFFLARLKTTQCTFVH